MSCFGLIEENMDLYHICLAVNSWLKDFEKFTLFRKFITFVFYLFWAKICFLLMFRTIFSTKQVNSGKNRENHKKINKQSRVMFWLNWRKYRAVSYFFRYKRGYWELLDGRLRGQIVTVWKNNIFGKLFLKDKSVGL